eukprot:CAMPEP_0184708748 /NCGR_PEP_ID=MMETSP0313-20130426/37934_1 /TAXON_ID=2792 /ORGANISM="Porphyridium aerugineum, Strain SAG 1380-2" /LENGTH=489 /DNA_ID=CAMNT_0027170349 /DNA_START=151 /DNA_END=1620 /DNA_ORIENTATION=+
MTSINTSANTAERSWTALDAQLVKLGIPSVSEAVDTRYGPYIVNELKDNSLRLFDHNVKEEDVQLTLYADPALWCPYCQRMRMQLELKQIPYRIRTINMRSYGTKPDYYLDMVPSGLLPALGVKTPKGEQVLTESLDIMMFIENAFKDKNPLLPPRDSKMYETAMKLMRLEREMFSLWCGFLFRPSMNDAAKQNFERGLQAWSDALSNIAPNEPFLLGSKPSLVDLLAIPFFERFDFTCIYWKNMQIRKSFPKIHEWMAAMEAAVPAFSVSKADVYSTSKDIVPQYGKAYYASSLSPDGRNYQEVVDGWKDSWELPLPPLKDELDWVPIAETDDGLGMSHRIQAAQRVIKNHERLVRFALRAAKGSQRPRTVTAPLSDPNAIIRPENPQTEILLDSALKFLCSCLLNSELDRPQAALLPVELANAPKEVKEDVITCLAYFRDRIGVPRDLPFAAARVLRAWINGVCCSMFHDDKDAWLKFKAQTHVSRS